MVEGVEVAEYELVAAFGWAVGQDARKELEEFFFPADASFLLATDAQPLHELIEC